MDDRLLERGAAFGQYQYVDVTFTLANTDLRIRHELKAVPYDEVYYIPIKKDVATDIYNGTASLWSQQHIALKATVPATVTLLLFTRKT